MLCGQTIQGYTLSAKLGQGGMAEVWRADNAQGESRAIKLLNEEFLRRADVVERFRNEAQVMMRLRHPNICAVYEYSEELQGRPAIVMELLEGQDLASLMQSGRRFGDGELIPWWNTLVDVLRYTHRQGIVHRDIKPSNIFLTTAGEVKLLDFGVAKLGDSLTLTKTGHTIGTTLYMSPEQVKDSKHLDYRTDIYSLAVTFYHLLSGIAPYDLSTDSAFEVQTKICQEPLELGGWPREWQAMLRPLLEKEPEQRGELRRFDEPVGDGTQIFGGGGNDGNKGNSGGGGNKSDGDKKKGSRLKAVIVPLIIAIIGLGWSIMQYSKSSAYSDVLDKPVSTDTIESEVTEAEVVDDTPKDYVSYGKRYLYLGANPSGEDFMKAWLRDPDANVPSNSLVEALKKHPLFAAAGVGTASSNGFSLEKERNSRLGLDHYSMMGEDTPHLDTMLDEYDNGDILFGICIQKEYHLPYLIFYRYSRETHYMYEEEELKNTTISYFDDTYRFFSLEGYKIRIYSAGDDFVQLIWDGSEFVKRDN